MILPALLLLQAAALPPPAGEEGAVLGVVTQLLDGLTTRDTAAMAALVLPEGTATAVVDGQVRRRPLGQFVKLPPSGPQLVERLDGRPAIEVDGDIAMLWGAYTFLLDGKVSHCGVDHFDLVREGGRWRVANITWTQRKTGCLPR